MPRKKKPAFDSKTEVISFHESKYSDKIKNLQEQTKNYSKKYEQQTQKQHSLKIVIGDLENKLLHSSEQNNKRKKQFPDSSIAKQAFREEERKENQVDSQASGQKLQSLFDLQKVRNKIEYDLQNIIQKHNQSLAQINLLKEQVNIARSERVIYSNIFKDLEKEIRDYQQELKRLIIQKIKADQQYKQAEEEQKKIKFYISAGDKEKKKAKRSSAEEKAQELARQEMTLNSPNRKRAANQEEEKRHLNKSRAITNLPQKLELQKAEIQICFDKLREQSGVSIDQLMEIYDKIQQINSEAYNKSNKYSDQIDELEKELASVEKTISKRQKKLRAEESEKVVRVEKEVDQQVVLDELNEKNRELSRSIIQIKDKFVPIAELLGIQAPEPQSSEQHIQSFIKAVQGEICWLITNAGSEFQGQDQTRARDEGEWERRERMLNELHDRVEKQKEEDRVLTKEEFQERVLRLMDQKRDKKKKTP